MLVAAAAAYLLLRTTHDHDHGHVHATPSSDNQEPAEVAPPPPDIPIPAGSVTTNPKVTDELLTNPGAGFASFHFGWWCNLPPITYPPAECAKRVRKNWPADYPASGTAYFRWHWRDIEPVRGEIAFDLIDATIQSANALDMTLAFRVMTVDEAKAGLPEWLTSAPYNVKGAWRPGGGGNTFWPDYRDPTFQREHARLVAALAKRYDGHPAVDHVDVGSVGCWGEWNTACLSDEESIVEVYEPSGGKERTEIKTAFQSLIDHHLEGFERTPVVMLSLDPDNADLLAHATRGGAGWRADCWGDWGMWGGSWSHQTKLYPAMIKAASAADPGFLDTWKRAPVQLEICGTLDKWEALGWTADKPNGVVWKTFEWALAQHASLLNAKSRPVPSVYLSAVDHLLTHVGYRFVVDAVHHRPAVHPGDTLVVVSDWRNVGVAPAYLPRTLTYRLVGASPAIAVESAQDTTGWLPGSWRVQDSITIPADLSPGTYEVQLALLDRDGSSPATKALPPTELAIHGRTADGWYPVSRVKVESQP